MGTRWGQSFDLPAANPAPPGVFPDNNVIMLSFPAIVVKRGDVLAVTQLKPGYGGAGVVTGRETSADFNGGALSASNTIARNGFRLNAAAHTSAFRHVGVIPVAGSAAYRRSIPPRRRRFFPWNTRSKL